MATVDKLVVACELLDRSLRLYHDGDSNYSSLHLAGAAEEILGVYVKKRGGRSAFSSFKLAGAKISEFLGAGSAVAERDIGDLMNFPKNQTKHGDGPVTFDAREEAKELLDRAVTNYYALMSYYPELRETELIARFNRQIVTGA